LLSVVKVLIRFPGLMRVAPGTRDRLAECASVGHPEYSRRPFTNSHAPVGPVPYVPYTEASCMFNHETTRGEDGVHRCHPPDQQLNPGNKPSKSNINTLKRKRDV
jgi:hypothetical protein